MSDDDWDDDCSATTTAVAANDCLNGSNNNNETKKFRVDPSKTESVVFQVAVQTVQNSLQFDEFLFENSIEIFWVIFK